MQVLRLLPLSRPFRHDGGAAFTSVLYQPVGTGEQAVLIENGIGIGSSDAMHQDIRDHGGGRFSLWNGVLYFSASDGSNCNKNGRDYQLALVDSGLIRALTRRDAVFDTNTKSLCNDHTQLRTPRSPKSDIPKNLAFKMQAGIMSYKYKGISTLKCPFDLAIYAELLADLKPRTIVEFGSNMGGSALWLADTVDALGLHETKVYTLDIVYLHEYKDPRVSFLHCDVSDIRTYLSDELVSRWKHPILMIDDASHQYQHSLNILNFFHEISRPGDYVIVEDGSSSIMDAEAQYDGGPHRALYEFVIRKSDEYEVDRARCDRFGHNVTWNIDGYIRRVVKRDT
jgi:cephalosporin hydroxylase